MVKRWRCLLLIETAHYRLFGTVTNRGGFNQGLGLKLTPSVLLGYQNSDTSGSDSILDPSLTGFYNIKLNLTAGLTLNTAFSGTEVYERQINLGRFSLDASAFPIQVHRLS